MRVNIKHQYGSESIDKKRNRHLCHTGQYGKLLPDYLAFLGRRYVMDETPARQIRFEDTELNLRNKKTEKHGTYRETSLEALAISKFVKQELVKST